MLRLAERKKKMFKLTLDPKVKKAYQRMLTPVMFTMLTIFIKCVSMLTFVNYQETQKITSTRLR